MSIIGCDYPSAPVVGAERMIGNAGVWVRTHFQQKGHYLCATTYLVAAGRPKVFELRIDLRPLEKLALQIHKRLHERQAKISGEPLVGWNLKKMWRGVKKTAKKVGRSKLVKAVARTTKTVVRATKKVVKSKVTGALGAVLTVFPPTAAVGAGLTAAYVAANAAVKALEGGEKVVRGAMQAKREIQSGIKAARGLAKLSGRVRDAVKARGGARVSASASARLRAARSRSARLKAAARKRAASTRAARARAARARALAKKRAAQAARARKLKAARTKAAVVRKIRTLPAAARRAAALKARAALQKRAKAALARRKKAAAAAAKKRAAALRARRAKAARLAAARRAAAKKKAAARLQAARAARAAQARKARTTTATRQGRSVVRRMKFTPQQVAQIKSAQARAARAKQLQQRLANPQLRASLMAQKKKAEIAKERLTAIAEKAKWGTGSEKFDAKKSAAIINLVARNRARVRAMAQQHAGGLPALLIDSKGRIRPGRFRARAAAPGMSPNVLYTGPNQVPQRGHFAVVSGTPLIGSPLIGSRGGVASPYIGCGNQPCRRC